jgi:hypothetical protein
MTRHDPEQGVRHRPAQTNHQLGNGTKNSRPITTHTPAGGALHVHGYEMPLTCSIIALVVLAAHMDVMVPSQGLTRARGSADMSRAPSFSSRVKNSCMDRYSSRGSLGGTTAPRERNSTR